MNKAQTMGQTNPAGTAEAGIWCVMRQDDNGHVVTIVDGLDREAAQAMAAMFEARGHKQTYWIRRQ